MHMCVVSQDPRGRAKLLGTLPRREMNGASVTRVWKSSQAVEFPWYLPINHVLVPSQLADHRVPLRLSPNSSSKPSRREGAYPHQGHILSCPAPWEGSGTAGRALTGEGGPWLCPVCPPDWSLSPFLHRSLLLPQESDPFFLPTPPSHQQYCTK